MNVTVDLKSDVPPTPDIIIREPLPAFYYSPNTKVTVEAIVPNAIKYIDSSTGYRWLLNNASAGMGSLKIFDLISGKYVIGAEASL